ncbi:lineage-specific thermal regulator protein [Peptococcaceae bacterium CEB3]|nr:lineage-specific thermal regulator protein [Peptococcaceae bacterium CEB3]
MCDTCHGPEHGHDHGMGHGGGHGDCHCKLSGKVERFIQPCLLLSLLQHPSHGYELLERLTGFRFYPGSPDTGAVYRHLRRLENSDYVESRWETGDAGPAKRIYSITPDGQDMLKAWIEEFRDRKSAMEDFIEKYERSVK